MLKISVEDKEDRRKIELQASGGLKELCEQMAAVIHSLYDDLKRSDPAQAKIYKMAMLAATLPDCPAWDREREGIHVCAVEHRDKE